MYHNKKDMNICPYCNSTNIGVGYQLGNGRMFADEYAYHSGRDSSQIEYLICKECRAIISAKVTDPSIFRQANTVRDEELEYYLECHGIILCNESKVLPSIIGMGYNSENLINLINKHSVFYTKAFLDKSAFLSPKAYYLLKRCRAVQEMTGDSLLVYNAIKSLHVIEKPDLRNHLENMEKKQFDKAFEFLLKNLFITAYIGNLKNSSWFTYLYSTSENWEKDVNGLHFSGDTKKALYELLVPPMNEGDFKKLILD